MSKGSGVTIEERVEINRGIEVWVEGFGEAAKAEGLVGRQKEAPEKIMDMLDQMKFTHNDRTDGKYDAVKFEISATPKGISQAQILGALKHASLKSPKGSKNSKLAH